MEFINTAHQILFDPVIPFFESKQIPDILFMCALFATLTKDRITHYVNTIRHYKAKKT